MAEKSTKQTLWGGQQFSGSLENLFKPTPLTVVKDPYSGKYYGSLTWDQVKSQIANATAYYKDILDPKHDLLASLRGQPTHNNLSDLAINHGQDPKVEAKAALANLSLLNKENYVYKERFLDSYDAYQPTWDRYFEASYKNPRMTEASQQESSKAQQAYDHKVQLYGSLNVPSPNQDQPSPKTVGTGLSNSKGGTSPFGTLDTGLNI